MGIKGTSAGRNLGGPRVPYPTGTITAKDRGLLGKGREFTDPFARGSMETCLKSEQPLTKSTHKQSKRMAPNVEIEI